MTYLVLEKMATSLRAAVSKFLKAPVADDKAVRELLRDVQRALLQSDVNVELVLKLTKKVEEVSRTSLPPGLTRRDLVLKAVYEELINLLGGEMPAELKLDPTRTNVILLLGVQGSGKTTSAAKLALFLKRKGYKPALVCADNFRPAAYEQLQQLGEQAKVPVLFERASDSIAMAKKGVEKAKDLGLNVVIVDTAGRHKEERALMEEAKQLVEALKPDEVILVVDATIGQQAKAQAEAFSQAVQVGSIFLTKLDGAARGGGALSAVAATNATIKFVGVGEKLDEIELFDPKSFVSRLLGMGDVRAFVEKARAAELSLGRKVEDFLVGRFTLKDLLSQIEGVKRMGPFRKVLELVPSFSLKLPPEAADVAEEKLKKWSAILKSMTQKERETPEIIDKSRMRRIARGSGVEVKEVKEVLNYYYAARKWMRQFARRGKKLDFLLKELR
ncbi:MAG: signal recognition particle receptor subunit alpha [Candidatus Nezhaarchaeota archaeon]|nr:signal recognition particle receptor subunit alpha [Candidatus Nezhaarchaeota archaeon]